MSPKVNTAKQIDHKSIQFSTFQFFLVFALLFCMVWLSYNYYLSDETTIGNPLHFEALNVWIFFFFSYVNIYVEENIAMSQKTCYKN